jgi:putative ABC transport system substrate-binding protein
MISRRKLMKGALASVVAAPLVASAQERLRRIGILVGAAEGDAEGERWVRSFLEGMQALGWQRGTNVQIDVRWGRTIWIG